MSTEPTVDIATTKTDDYKYHITIEPYNDTVKDEYYLFISYAHKDTRAVDKIVRKLEEAKFRMWYDDSMEIGEDFREQLEKKISDEHCHGLLFFSSKNSMSSPFCCMEVICAYKYDKKIFPISLEDDVVIPDALKLLLSKPQHGKNVIQDDHFQSLVETLPQDTRRRLAIEDGVLKRCLDGSKELSVPDEVHTIEHDAFKDCKKLMHINLGNNVEMVQREAFRGCSALEEIVISTNIKKVGESCFRDCTSMKSLKVESPDVELGERSFENCASLSEIELNDKITEIYGGAFNSCKALKEIRLPAKLTVLGESAFADCSNLRSVTIPVGVTKIDDMVFNGCSRLANVELNKRLTKLGKNAFKDCKSLKEIFIPQSVNSIGTGVFRGCSELEKIVVETGNKAYKAVNNVLFNKNKSNIICYAAKNKAETYEVPDSVTTICNWAFSNTLLKEITIPDSVMEIGEGAFCNCEDLVKLDIPDSVTRIDDSAFRGCSALETLIIRGDKIDFGWGVLSGCNLEKLVVHCKVNSSANSYCKMKNIKCKFLDE